MCQDSRRQTPRWGFVNGRDILSIMASDLPRIARIRAESRFRQLLSDRCTAADARCVVYAGLDPAAVRPRLGLVVGRKHGSAVRRNRIKRLLRAAFRVVQARLDTGCDFVVVPRPSQRPTLDGYIRTLEALAPRAAARARRDAQRPNTRPNG